MGQIDTYCERPYLGNEVSGVNKACFIIYTFPACNEENVSSYDCHVIYGLKVQEITLSFLFYDLTVLATLTQPSKHTAYGCARRTAAEQRVLKVS